MIIYNVRFKSNKAIKRKGESPLGSGRALVLAQWGLVTHCLWQPPSSADPLVFLESII